MKNLLLISLSILFFQHLSYCQQKEEWNGKKCAVVLTYDDALNVHLDSVLPALNQRKLKGTFYVAGDNPVVSKRLEDWRKLASQGHELGNHSLTHACHGNMEGREWVGPEQDLSKYSVARAQNEIKVTNTLLYAIDGKKERTYAYACGDRFIDGVSYIDDLKDEFVGARGVESGFETKESFDLFNFKSFVMNNHTGEQMIELVQQAEKEGALLIFLFHGVGGEHSLNVSNSEHNKLLDYLEIHQKDIWVAPMVEVAEYVQK